ncbi:hypothetical protein C9374_001792 [Naegleria lovaniensis]|uniref:Peptidase S53 domain-containing protein n=1 Tax=Naegleria lovaniensis TaxID=51637 RepID=A0AA88KL44_NAELO|nr:uncharacterized protein C9374_001792 [Naegleria lovaniensis]KAG2387460.1 hypothetical protein C9374_001792 [Naegleria lovaniensis]
MHALDMAQSFLSSPYVQMKYSHQLRVPPSFQPLSESHVLKTRIALENQRVRLTFALKHRNTEWLTKTFERVSNPDSEDYGNFLSMAQVAKITAPEDSHSKALFQFLNSIPDVHITHLSKHLNFVTVRMSVKSVDTFLKAKMKPFVHKDNGQVLFRSIEGFALPLQVAPGIHTVFGIHHFPQYRRMVKHRRPLLQAKDLSESPITTPQSIWKRYNMTRDDLNAIPFPKNRQAIASFLGEYYSPKDLEMFQQAFNLSRIQPIVNGPNDASKPGIEASLDIQYIMATGHNMNTTINSIPDEETADPFLDWIALLQSQGEECAQVHSISYGAVEKYIPEDVQMTLDYEFQKLAVTGRTVLIASGDDGARCSEDQNSFEPEWPTSSPYVTSVGATKPSNRMVYWRNYSLQEEATEWSGGGFSNAYSRPSYQNDAVTSYLSQPHLPSPKYFNRNGRAYPDISAFGVNYQVMHQGKFESVDGTSASTPVVAGMIALLNDARMRQGMKPLGFLNYWLYKKVALQQLNAFYDVVFGNNAMAPCPGFPATKGFDVVTGWGTPNFEVLKKIALEQL